MTYRNTGGNNVIGNRSFSLFMLSQGISNFGDAFQFIAITTLLVKITGSGLSAAFGLITYPILSILISPFAGYLCDIKNEKLLLILLDLARGFTAFLFISKRDISKLYVLIILLSILDILYSPPRRKFMTGILDSSRLMAGNSMLSGLSGGVFVIGPVLAGFVVSKYGPDIAFLVNSLSFLISALSIISVRYGKTKPAPHPEGTLKPGSRAVASLLEGARYCFNTYALRRIILLLTVVCFVTTSVSLAFYPFAFDVMKINDKLWGSMMSIFYGSNLIAMPLPLLMKFKTDTYYKAVIPFALVIVSVIWFIYGNTVRIGAIMLLQLLEGTVLSYLGIILSTHLQMESQNYILGRVSGISDLIVNLGRVISIGFTYVLLRITEPNIIFLLCALALFTYAFFTLASTSDNRLKAL